MARIGTLSGNLLDISLRPAEGNQGTGHPSLAPGRRRGAQAFRAGRIPTSGTLDGPETNFPTNLADFYWRGYIYVDELPTSGEPRFLQGDGTVEGIDNAWYLTLDSGGVVRLYSKGNGTAEQIGSDSSVTLATGRWYRLSGHIVFRGTTTIKIDGVSVISGSAVQTTGLGHLSSLGNSLSMDPTPSAGGGLWRLAEFVVDDAAEPADGGMTLCHVNGNGTDQDWINSDPIWRRVIGHPVKTTTGGLTNDTVSKAQTFTVPSLVDLGFDAGTVIKSVRPIIYANMQRANWKYRIRVNGSVTDSGALAAVLSTAGWTTAQTGPAGGWFLDAGTLAVAPGDTIEIGVVDGPSGSGTSVIYGAFFLVDWEGTAPEEDDPDESIVVAVGSGTGNNQAQDVAFADPNFFPTFMIILGEGSVGNPQSAVWCRDWAADGHYSHVFATQDPADSGLCRVYRGGFTIKGGSTSINATGQTFRYLAIQDESGRMVRGLVDEKNSYQNGSLNDDVNFALDDPTFVIDAIFTWASDWAGSVSSRVFYRDTNTVGDKAFQIDVGQPGADSVADRIQSVGTGTFQVGTGLQGSSQTNLFALLLTKAAAAFTAKKLLDIVTWTGNGSSPRDITFDIDVNPGLVIVIPEDSGNAGERHYRFFSDGNGSTSRTIFNGTTRTDRITAFDTVGQFTVGANCNLSGVTYRALIFGDGVDPAPTETELPENGIGITWVELTDKQGDLHVWSNVDLPDPADYYGGFKESRVTQWGRLSRALSDREGQFETADFSWIAHDADRYIRGLLAADSTKYFKNRPAVVRMIDDDSRRALLLPRTVIRGYITDYQPQSPLLFEFKAKDILSAKFAAVGSNPLQVPSRTIEVDDFPDCPTEWIGKAVPIIYGSVTDTPFDADTGGGGSGTESGPVEARTYGGVPGGWWPHGLGLDTPEMGGNQYSHTGDDDVIAAVDADHRSWCTLPGDPPTNLAGSAISGGSLPDNFRGGTQDYAFMVTAVNAGVETDPSQEVVVAAGQSGAGRSVRLTWTAPSPAPDGGYRVYFCNNPFAVPPKFCKRGFVDGKFVMVGSNYVRRVDVAAGTTTVDITAEDQGVEADFDVAYIYKITAVFPDGSESAASGEILGLSHPYPRPLQIRWRAYTGAVGYRIYRRAGDGDGAFDRTIEVGPNGYDGIVHSIDGEDQLIYCDDFDDTATAVSVGTVNPPPAGQVPAIYVGTEVISGTTWSRFLICGHAVKVIGNVYQNGTRIRDARYGSDVLCPGKTGWPHADDYVDINGRRYTLIYATGNVADEAIGGTKPLTVNVDGIEDVGDGTGALITDIHLQYLHCIQNWILGNYDAGAWLATPTFEDDPTLKQVDDDSFVAASAVAAQRIAGGYVGAGVIGWNGEQLTVREVVARFNVSGDVNSGFNRKCQFFVSMVDDSIAALATAVPLTDALNIISDTFQVKDDLAAHANLIPVSYARDYASRVDTGWLNQQDISDSPSITNYTTGSIDGTARAPDLNLELVRDATTALDVAYRRLMRQKDPPRIVSFEIGLQGMNYDLGDVVQLTHYQGVGASGWAGQPMRIIRHEADPNNFSVALDCFDMQALFSGAFILGDETALPAAWTSASLAEQQYGYLCDETTGKFSDGKPGKRLR